MRKRISCIFFFVLTLLLFSSCGTPTVIDFTDAITLSRTVSDNTLTLSVEVDEDEFENVSTGDLDSSSPALLLLYSVSDSNSIRYSSFISKFSSEVKGKNYFGYPISNLDDGICEISISSSTDTLTGTYRLYPLLRSGVSDVYDPTYTYSQSDGIVDYLGSDPYKFVITAVQNASDSNVYDFNIEVIDKNSSTVESIPFYRYNGNSFPTLTSSNITSSDEDYSIKTANSGHTFSAGSTSINFFAAVNLRGDFSNIFWSSLFYIGSITLN